jgi:TRAP-type mannitol/chloroaromatic compound transport system substrate-binding protein
MKKFSVVVFLFVALALLVSFGSSPAAAAKKYKLQIQTAVPNASVYFKLLDRMAKRVDAMSAGRLKIKVLPAGAVVPVFEILDAVDKGIVNGGFAWTHYWSGKHPAGLLFSAPTAGLGFGLDQLSTMSFMYDGGGNELYQEYFTKILGYNIRGFMCMPMGPEPFGWFKKPFKSLADLKEMKFRSPPGIPSESFKAIGIPAVSMPGGEIVPSAQRGVIDAAEWISPADDKNLGLSSVWKNYYLQGLHQAISIGDIYINLDFWKKLPKDLKAIFEGACMAMATDTYNWNVSANAKALKEMVTTQDVVLHETSDEYITAYMKAAKEILDKYAAKDPFFKKVLTKMQEWAKLTVPYQSKANGVYYKLGKGAMDAGVVSNYK